jgi:uncharacterized 2Fe-2S/4Fe-4S cluster protein (DUF4445 family)
MTDVSIEFQPGGKRVSVSLGTFLTEAIEEAGILLPLDCGGNGTCGRCRVRIDGDASPPDEAEIKVIGKELNGEGWRLACRTTVLGNLTVTLSDSVDTLETSWDIHSENGVPQETGSPVITSTDLNIPQPAMTDPRSDLRRVLECIPVTSGIPPFSDHVTAGLVSTECRRRNWNIGAFLRGAELVGVGAPSLEPFGIAVDLGSTKVAAYLVGLVTGNILASMGRLNPQIAFGADVVTRIQRAIQRPDDGLKQTLLIRQALNGMARDLAHQVGVDIERICEMSVVGNSVMIHLLLGLPLEQLGSPPFVSSIEQAMDIKSREIGITLSPGAYVHIPPLVGGFVGSDNVAMIIGSDLDRPGGCRLGLDIGTNTEVVVTSPDSSRPLYIASAPSGPTFEGAHLSSGMRALGGAISKVTLSDGHISVTTIDGQVPKGICGSGIIDAVSELLRAGIINRQGHLDRTQPGVATGGDIRSIRYRLVHGSETATGNDIVLTQKDIGQVQLAKAAIIAAAEILLSKAGLKPSDITEVVLAGSFGSHIDLESARRIGLIPDIPRAVYRQVGNAAGKGARMVLNAIESRRRSEAVPGLANYVELTGEKQFNTLFARNLSFPSALKGPQGSV